MGAINSSVVALQMVLPNWLPARECFAAVSLQRSKMAIQWSPSSSSIFQYFFPWECAFISNNSAFFSSFQEKNIIFRFSFLYLSEMVCPPVVKGIGWCRAFSMVCMAAFWRIQMTTRSTRKMLASAPARMRFNLQKLKLEKVTSAHKLPPWICEPHQFDEFFFLYKF